jgi:enamine deaminase RidA (YjgF/YER057c/UK114 family)
VSVRIYVVAYEPHKAEAATPASTWVGGTALADPGFLIEIEAVADLD